MERLSIGASVVVVLAVLLACKSKKEDDTSSTATVTSAAAAPSDSATPSATAAASSAAPTASAPSVKLEDCGQRYAAPARVDGKCADYCGGDYKCGPGETCTATSWMSKTGPRNTQVCAPKGIKVNAPIPGAPWDNDGPGKSTTAATPSATASGGSPEAIAKFTAQMNELNGEMDDDKGKCPSGWTLAEDACHKPCAKDAECNPPKTFCKKWQGKKMCAFTGSLVVPND